MPRHDEPYWRDHTGNPESSEHTPVTQQQQAVESISYSSERRGDVIAQVTFNADDFGRMSESERVAAATVRENYSHDLLSRLTLATYSHELLLPYVHEAR